MTEDDPLPEDSPELAHLAEDEEESRPFPQPEHSITPRKPRTVGGAVYLAVLGCVIGGIVLAMLDRWQPGLTVMGVALVTAAVLRLVLRNEQAGMLGLRRKLIDVATLAVLGGGLVVLAAVIPEQPPL